MDVDMRSARLDELVAAAVDLMESQQADDGSLRELAVIVREAYELGREGVMCLTPREVIQAEEAGDDNA